MAAVGLLHDGGVPDALDVSTDDPAVKPQTGLDRRGYSWPPFEPGHTLSLRHGAYSPRRVEPLAAEIVEAFRGHQPDWVAAVDDWAVWAWARTEARIQLLEEWLAAHGGDLAATGEVRGAAAFLLRCEIRAERQRARLGLDPLSRARLGADVASAGFDLARAMAMAAERERALLDEAEIEVPATDREIEAGDDNDDKETGRDG